MPNYKVTYGDTQQYPRLITLRLPSLTILAPLKGNLTARVKTKLMRAVMSHLGRDVSSLSDSALARGYDSNPWGDVRNVTVRHITVTNGNGYLRTGWDYTHDFGSGEFAGDSVWIDV